MNWPPITPIATPTSSPAIRAMAGISPHFLTVVRDSVRTSRNGVTDAEKSSLILRLGQKGCQGKRRRPGMGKTRYDRGPLRGVRGNERLFSGLFAFLPPEPSDSGPRGLVAEATAKEEAAEATLEVRERQAPHGAGAA